MRETRSDGRLVFVQDKLARENVEFDHVDVCSRTFIECEMLSSDFNSESELLHSSLDSILDTVT